MKVLKITLLGLTDYGSSSSTPAMEISFDLISSLAQLNVAYLGIVLGALTIIIGGLYLFSISPIRESLKNQEKSFTNEKLALNKKIDKLEKEVLVSIKSDFNNAIKNSSSNFQSIFTKELEKTKSDLQDIRVALLVDIDKKIDNFKKSDLSFIQEAQLKNDDLLRKSEKDSQKHLNSIKDLINALKNEINDSKYKIRELEAFKYSQEGRMGAVISQIDLLEQDLENKKWNLKFRLPDLKRELERTAISPDLATRLRVLLKQITEEGLIELVTETSKSIQIKGV